MVIIKQQFIRNSNILLESLQYKGAVQCLLLVLWKHLVSEVGMREKLCLIEHVFER